MNRYLTLWLFGMAMVALLGSGSPAGAMSAYSRIYKMECSACHTKNVPELNDFGIEFYKNRLVIPGKDKGGKPADVQGTAAGGTAAKPASGAESTAPRTSAVAEENVSGEGAEEQKPVEEPPPTVVYRVKSADGSVFFTDNPLRKGGAPPEQGVRGKRHAARTRKVAVQSGVKRNERPHSAAESSGAGRVAAVVKEHYRSYEECMERSLVGSAAPGSAQEMMEFLTAVEKKCAAFPPEKR
ncbi:cytochrome C [Geobacter hydrogenophilus]|uniref:Cytochrome c domain-containing protein n=1 Tax=Geobacter hydrogenophilus TaxID=40983 RepID=A0A9W6G0V8_9BACT|nr:cytochrome C [Geobacter hydrogenophilus]MBT0892763.1 cytochrome C [Geobacter hydrogenophilus]GLI38764.1 hypothetical protein GHYDROH2_22650 [Geobacter hydrogenophilus]